MHFLRSCLMNNLALSCQIGDSNTLTCIISRRDTPLLGDSPLLGGSADIILLSFYRVFTSLTTANNFDLKIVNFYFSPLTGLKSIKLINDWRGLVSSFVWT